MPTTGEDRTGRPIQTRSRSVKLRKLFAFNGNKDLSAGIARLSVLYEDLKIEIAGFSMKPESIDQQHCCSAHFDSAGHLFRELYFLRRAICTCVEFAEAIRRLHELHAIDDLLNSLTPERQEMWHQAEAYFKSKEGFWKKIRNDIGGHFGEAAARFAVNTFEQEADGIIEVQSTRRGRDRVIFKFTSEIVATALLRHLKEDRLEAKIETLFDELHKSLEYAVKAVDSVVFLYVWERTS